MGGSLIKKDLAVLMGDIETGMAAAICIRIQGTVSIPLWEHEPRFRFTVLSKAAATRALRQGASGLISCGPTCQRMLPRTV